MELKERMYVRIKNKAGYCVIGEIENINDFREPMAKYCIDIQGNDFIFVPEEMIIKASNNIIDLIEVGDYVNGHKVSEVKRYEVELELVGCFGEEFYSETIPMNDIKSIVTKEQFESMSYKVN